jgi:transposase-like protein
VDKKAARRFFTGALAGATAPTEVSTDRAPAYPRIVEDMLPGALHVTVRYANNRIEADHGRLKARLRPMRGLKRDRSLRVVATGHAFVQNLRRGHYELATEAAVPDRGVVAFTELSHRLMDPAHQRFACPAPHNATAPRRILASLQL